MNTYTIAKSGASPAREHYIVTMCSLFVLLTPSLIEQIPHVQLTIQAATVALFVLLVLRMLNERATVSAGLVAFALFRLSFLPGTLATGGDIANWGYASVAQVSLFMLIDASRRASSGGRLALRCIADLLFAYLAINAIMVATGTGVSRIWANGYVETWYLLGIRTRVTDCLFVALAASATIDALNGRRLGVRTFLVAVLGTAQVGALSVATALIGLAVALAGFILFRFAPVSQGLLSMRRISLLGVIVSVVVVIFRGQALIGTILEGVFDKDATLTGRTSLWDGALDIVMQRPWLGHGINDIFGAFIPRGDVLWQAHNQYLQLAYDGGLIAVAAFVALLLVCAREFDALPGVPAKAPILAVYLAFAVMMATEIYTYNMGLFFVLPFVACQFDRLITRPAEAGPRLSMTRPVGRRLESRHAQRGAVRP